MNTAQAVTKSGFHVEVHEAMDDSLEFLQSLELDAKGRLVLDCVQSAAWAVDGGKMNYAPEVREALTMTRGFIDGYIDVNDGDYGEPEPNHAMRLADLLDGALRRL